MKKTVLGLLLVLICLPLFSTAQSAVAVIDNAPVLYAPSKTATRLHSLKFGTEKVTITEETVQVQEDRLRTYVKVVLLDGITGWMNQYHLVENGDGAVCLNNTDVFQNPVDGITKFRNKSYEAGEPMIVLEMVDAYAHVIGKDRKKEGWIPVELVAWGNEDVRTALVLEQIRGEKNLQKRKKKLEEIRSHEGFMNLQIGGIIDSEYAMTLDKLNSGYVYTTDTQPTEGLITENNSQSSNSRLRGDQQERILNPGDQVTIVAPQAIRRAETLRIIEVINEAKNIKNSSFECYHKNLPVGTIVQMLLPDNAGFIELKVVGALRTQEGLGLAPGTIHRIFGNEIPSNVNIEYLFAGK